MDGDSRNLLASGGALRHPFCVASKVFKPSDCAKSPICVVGTADQADEKAPTGC